DIRGTPCREADERGERTEPHERVRRTLEAHVDQRYRRCIVSRYMSARFRRAAQRVEGERSSARVGGLWAMAADRPPDRRTNGRRRDQLTDDDYRRLLEFRDGLRRFLHWSEQQAKAVGLTAMQHQLLLSIRGHDDPLGPTIRDVAG